MFQYLFRLLKNLPSMLSITIMTALLFHGRFNYNVYCVACVPFPGLIFWIYLFECTYQCFRKALEGRIEGAGLDNSNLCQKSPRWASEFAHSFF